VGEGQTHFGLFPGCQSPDVFALEMVSGDPAGVGGCC